jgi:GNAT superfamily N-acetyltransferase
MKQQGKIIEETSLNAWPCLQQLHYDGWILRFANGYTRRANSVNPLYEGTLDVVTKIKGCQEIYHRRQLTPVFKISPFVQPPELDNLLADLGYRRNAPTSVQQQDLGAVPVPSNRSGQQWSTPTAAWVDAFVRLNRTPASQVPVLQDILQNIVPETNFSVVQHQQQPVSCGLAVLEGQYVGLFDLVTDPALRRRGFGTELILRLLAWALERGASTAYLQVMLNNKPAQNLYARLGFEEIYQYWYRVLPGSG